MATVSQKLAERILSTMRDREEANELINILNTSGSAAPLTIRIITGDDTFNAADGLLLCDRSSSGGSNTFNITLPTAPDNGFTAKFAQTNSGSNIYQLNPGGTDTLDPAVVTVGFTTAHQESIIYYNGIWYRIS